MNEELKAIFGVDTKPEILQMFKDEVNGCKNRNQLVNVLNKYTLYVYHKAEFSTIRNRFTEFRNIIKEVAKQHKTKTTLYEYGLEFFKAPDILNEYLNNAYKASINEKNDNRISTLPVIPFVAYKAFFDALAKDMINIPLKDRERTYILSILVTIATGRRFIEVLKKSTFSAGEKKNTVKVEGVAKQKSDIVKSIDIPVLFTNPKTVLAWVDELRKECFFDTEKMSESAINHKFSATFNNALRRYLSLFASPELQKAISTFHDLRAIYAESCHKLYNVKDGEEVQTKPRYFASILGHNENDEETQKSYIKFIVKE